MNPNGCRMTTTMTMRGKAFCKEEKSGMGNSSGVVFSNVLNLGRAGDLVIWRPLCSANKMLFLCSVRSALLWFAFALLVPCLCCCFQSIVPCFCLVLLCFCFAVALSLLCFSSFCCFCSCCCFSSRCSFSSCCCFCFFLYFANTWLMVVCEIRLSDCSRPRDFATSLQQKLVLVFLTCLACHLKTSNATLRFPDLF